MFRRTASLLFALTITAAAAYAFQNPALQQRVNELKESVAANKTKLQAYQWTETTTILLKGEVKKTEQNMCQYGPDGKVVKTPLGPPPAPPQQQRGVKGRIIEKKVDELKDYGERLKSLIGEYVPPTRENIQNAFQAGNASLTPSPGGVASLVFANYYKQGDKMTFAFDSASKRTQSITVNSYLDGPTDIVNLSVNFATLPDGTNHVASTDLQATGKNMEIKSANSGYQKLSQ